MVSTCSCRKCLGSACGPTQLVPLRAPPATTGRQELVGDIWLLLCLCERGFFMVLFLWGEEWAGKRCCWNRAGPSSPSPSQPRDPARSRHSSSAVSTGLQHKAASIQSTGKASISSQWGRNINRKASKSAGKGKWLAGTSRRDKGSVWFSALFTYQERSFPPGECEQPRGVETTRKFGLECGKAHSSHLHCPERVCEGLPCILPVVPYRRCPHMHLHRIN